MLKYPEATDAPELALSSGTRKSSGFRKSPGVGATHVYAATVVAIVLTLNFDADLVLRPGGAVHAVIAGLVSGYVAQLAGAALVNALRFRRWARRRYEVTVPLLDAFVLLRGRRVGPLALVKSGPLFYLRDLAGEWAAPDVPGAGVAAGAEQG